jgi:hypothetical protein
MELKDFLEHVNKGNQVIDGSEMHASYHKPEEIRTLFSKSIGKPVDVK